MILIGKRRTHEEFIKLCRKRNDFKEYKVLTKYTGAFDKIKFKHLVCGKTFMMTPHNFYYNKHKCPHCNKGSVIRKNSFEKVKQTIEGKKRYLLLDKSYINCKTKLHIKCLKCNNTFEMTFTDFKSGYRCPSCAGNKKLKYDDLDDLIKKINSNYKLCKKSKDKENYKNVHSKVTIKHKICGRSFIKSYNNFRNGQRCPYCTSEDSDSEAVKNIKIFLEEENIKYSTEVTFDDLYSPDSDKKLRIDFYLPDYDLYIEYDGKQHFEWSEKGIFTYDKYLKIKERDEIKDDYFRENNLRLVRISYKQNEIEILKSILFNDYHKASNK